MSALAWLGGRIIPLRDASLPMDDPGVLSGHSVFETIRVDGGVPVRLDAHLLRLRRSAAALDLPDPDLVLFRSIALSLARDDSRLRLGWTGSTPYGTLEPWDRARMYAECRAVSQPSSLDPILWGEAKHTSRAGHVVRLRRSGADEVLFVRDGRYTEGTWSAILGVVDGVLWCEGAGVLPSITAAAYCEYARRLGVEVIRRGPPVGCTTLYLVSSLRELCPVVELDGQRLHGWEQVGIGLRALSLGGSGD